VGWGALGSWLWRNPKGRLLDVLNSRVVAIALAVALLGWWVGPSCAVTLKTGEHPGTLLVRKGFRYLGVGVEGNSDMFLANNRQISSDALSLGGKFEQTLKVDVDMEVLPKLSVRGRFDDTLFPAKQELAVDYRGEDLTMTAGDLSVGFAGAEFPMESQNLFGVKGRYKQGRHDFMAVGAKLSGTAGHMDGQGDSTKGPYFLPDKKIVANSEKVFVDGIRKYRGTDYEIDYSPGVINFTESVDDRFKISVDYEYESIGAVLSSTLLVSRYAGEITTHANLGLSSGLKTSGGGAQRSLFGADGRVDLWSGTSLGGEMAVSREGSSTAMAFRSDASGTVKGVNWTAGARVVQPEYVGLGSVTTRRDAADVNLGINTTVGKKTRLSTRVSTSRNNLDNVEGCATQKDLVVDNSVSYMLPAGTRMELTFDNRMELHQDDLDVHVLDTTASSYRLGTRCRLNRHLARVSYEIRNNMDRGGDRNLESTTHVANSQLQSRLFGKVFSTTTLQLSRSLQGSDGSLIGQEILGGIDLSMNLLKHLGASSSYTLQGRTGGTESKTHSAVLTLRTQSLGCLSAEAAFQLKRTIPVVGEPTGDAIVSGKANYQIGTKGSLSADYQRRLAGFQMVGPVTLDTRGTFRPGKEFELGGGLKIDQLQDSTNSSSSYTGRIAYIEATLNF